MSDVRRLPFTEMVEKLMKDLIRDNSTPETKYKGYINDVYMHDIPAQIDWRNLRNTKYITTLAEYSTGYITDISGTTVTGLATSWTSANSNNLLLKVTGNDEVYRVTYVSSTELTLDRTWVETDISSTNTEYKLLQDRYALASDFSRLILDPDKSVYYWQDGDRVYLKYRDLDTFEMRQVTNSNEPSYYTIKWVNGDPYLFIDAPDNEARTLHYIYEILLKRLFEYTTGSVLTLANGSTSVTGTGTAWGDFIIDTTDHDYYLRIDGDGVGSDSQWYKISSVDSDTGITLASNYLGTAITTATTYTISVVSRLPIGLDLGILYGAALLAGADTVSELMINTWNSLSLTSINRYRTIEGKKNYGKKRMRTIYEKPGARR